MLWCVYCVCLYVCVWGVLGVAVRVCCLAGRRLFWLFPHVPLVRFDHLPWWFVVVVARLCAVVCVLTTYDSAFLGDFSISRVRVVWDLLLCVCVCTLCVLFMCVCGMCARLNYVFVSVGVA